MDSTSKPLELNLEPNDNEITFEGWHLLESYIYDLWLSPCGSWLVQHYQPLIPQDLRCMRTGWMHDFNLQDFKFRTFDRQPNIVGWKNYDFQIIIDFRGCHWYGREAWPEDLPELLKDLEANELTWPTLRPENLYRDPTGRLRTLGACTCWEWGSMPLNLNYWAMLLTPDELKEAESHLEYTGLDARLWHRAKFGGYL